MNPFDNIKRAKAWEKEVLLFEVAWRAWNVQRALEGWTMIWEILAFWSAERELRLNSGALMFLHSSSLLMAACAPKQKLFFPRQIAANFPSFLFSRRRQIALADLVILNKTDLAADQAQLQTHKTRIRFVTKTKNIMPRNKNAFFSASWTARAKFWPPKDAGKFITDFFKTNLQCCLYFRVDLDKILDLRAYSGDGASR